MAAVKVRRITAVCPPLLCLDVLCWPTQVRINRQANRAALLMGSEGCLHLYFISLQRPQANPEIRELPCLGSSQTWKFQDLGCIWECPECIVLPEPAQLLHRSVMLGSARQSSEFELRKCSSGTSQWKQSLLSLLEGASTQQNLMHL